jgi:hypothetical protein
MQQLPTPPQQTIMTIGYGLPAEMKEQPYFQQCDSALFLITLESLLGVMADALCVGLMYERMSRAQTRATTVVFSDFACISNHAVQTNFEATADQTTSAQTTSAESTLAKEQQEEVNVNQSRATATTLTFRVCEMRKHQLVEAHVRCYAIMRGPRRAAPVALRRRLSGKTATSAGELHSTNANQVVKVSQRVHVQLL